MSNSVSDVLTDSAPGAAAPVNREIVVGVDGSECALAAVRWAAREAAVRAAPLRILHAAPYLGTPPSPGAAPPELPRARSIAATAYTVARHAAPAAGACTEVVPDDPATALLRAASAAQLLVLGICTTGAADELVMAPVAQRVVARAEQPVVVVPRAGADVAASRPVVGVLGLGGPADDDAVAAFAAAAARRAGRPLELLELRAGAPGDDGWAGRFPDLAVRRTALPDLPPARLLAAACPTPLLVLPAGRGGRFHRRLDALHRRLLRHSTSPLALVPALAADSSAGS